MADSTELATPFLSAYVESQNIAVAVESIVGGSGTPADPFRLAPILGVTELAVVPLGSIDAFVEKTSQGFRVSLNSERPYPRRRFSLAHELAHILLGHVEGHRSIKLGNGVELKQARQRERLCDVIAAELLMPTRFMQDLLARTGVSLQSLQQSSAELGVSLTAVTLRAMELTRQQIMSIFWEIGSEPPLVVRSVRRSKSARGYFIPVGTAAHEASTVVRAPRAHQRFSGT
jgi:Zn-dependent peptidase ImmA (M78 family)